MTNPNFDNLTPPQELADCYSTSVIDAYRAGAAYGYEDGYAIGKGEWPDPITDRAPGPEDGDENGVVQQISRTYPNVWSRNSWIAVAANRQPWLHTPRWNSPVEDIKVLQKEALVALDWISRHHIGNSAPVRAVRRAVLARFSSSQPVPVALEEYGYPDRQQCGPEGWAWVYDGEDWQRLGWGNMNWEYWRHHEYTHWLPASALPVPEVKS